MENFITIYKNIKHWQVIATILLFGCSNSQDQPFEPMPGYYKELTGISILPKILFQHLGNPLAQDPQDITVYEFDNKSAEYFKNPPADFFKNHPIDTERNHKIARWKKAPIEDEDRKFFEIAFDITINDVDEKEEFTKTMNYIKQITKGSECYYSYTYSLSDTNRVSGVCFNIISPNDKKLICACNNR